MAIIQDEFILIDNFTAVFEDIIETGETVVDTITEVADATTGLEEASASASTSVERLAEMIAEVTGENDIATESVNAQAEALDKATESTEQNTEALLASNEQREALLDVESDIHNALEYTTEALQRNMTAEDLLKAQIKDVDSALSDQRAELERALSSFNNLSASEQLTAEEADKLTSRINELIYNIDTTIEEADELDQQLRELREGSEQGSKGVREAANEANYAERQFSNLLKQLTATTAAFFSLRTLSSGIQAAFAEEVYDVRLRATFGDEGGEAAMQYVRDIAYEYGRAINDVAEATTAFTRLTTNPQNLAALNELSDRFAWFTEGNDFGAVSNAINQALRTGNVRSLSTQTGISTNLLEQYGVTDAAKAGDVDAFVSGLYAAADAAGITQEAYDALMDTAEARWGRFTTNLQNALQSASRNFLNALAPALDKLNKWVDSEQATNFFNALGLIFEVVGAAAGFLVDGLLFLANFIADNLTTVLIVAGVAAGIFAVQMIIAAVASLAAAWPILLIVAAVALLIVGLNALGFTAADVFEFIGGVFGGTIAVIWNLIVDLWNLIAAFVEFFANVWNDPLGSVVRLFVSIFDVILGIIQTVAEAIDYIFGTELAAGVSGFRNTVNNWVTENFGEAQYQVARLERMDLADSVDSWREAGRDFGEQIDNIDLAESLGGLSDGVFGDLSGGIDSIGRVDEVGNIRGDINLADEDLRILVDRAEESRVIEVNVNTVAPQLSVEVNNTADNSMDENQIGNMLMHVITEQVAMHTNNTY